MLIGRVDIVAFDAVLTPQKKFSLVGLSEEVCMVSYLTYILVAETVSKAILFNSVQSELESEMNMKAELKENAKSYDSMRDKLMQLEQELAYVKEMNSRLSNEKNKLSRDVESVSQQLDHRESEYRKLKAMLNHIQESNKTKRPSLLNNENRKPTSVAFKPSFAKRLPTPYPQGIHHLVLTLVKKQYTDAQHQVKDRSFNNIDSC